MRINKELIAWVGPFLHLGRIFGIEPLNISSNSSWFSSPYYRYAFPASMIVLSLLTLIVFFIKLSFPKDTGSSLFLLINVFFRTVAFLSLCIWRLYFMHARGLYDNFSHRIRKVEKLLRTKRKRKSWERDLTMYFQIFIFLSHSVCLIAPIAVYIFLGKQIHCIILYVLFLYFWTTFMIVINQNIRLLLVFSKRVECLHEVVQKSVGIPRFRIYDTSDNPSKLSLTQKQIRFFASLHLCLVRSFLDLRKIVGPLYLILASQILANTTLDLHTINSSSSWDYEYFLLMSVGISWDSLYIALLFFSCYVIKKLHDQAKLTGVIVSEAILNATSHEARRELHLFSLQILNTRIKFTACGFFTLDLKLLTSIFAAATQYLVILFQFHFAGKSACECD